MNQDKDNILALRAENDEPRLIVKAFAEAKPMMSKEQVRCINVLLEKRRKT